MSDLRRLGFQEGELSSTEQFPEVSIEADKMLTALGHGRGKPRVRQFVCERSVGR